MNYTNIRHFLSLYDCTPGELNSIIHRAIELKKLRNNNIVHDTLKGRILGMIFDKSSTRTRISFESGIIQLGGNAIFLTPKDTQMGRGESIHDSAIVMSSMMDMIMIRTFGHDIVTEFAKYSSVPVINALTDMSHPCQIMADIQTFTELRGDIKGKTIAWIGDGNNICNSYIEAAKQFDFQLNVACPEGYEPNANILKTAKGHVDIMRDPADAVKNAHIVTTDVFVSMGQEQETQLRMQHFKGYQVTEALLDKAASDVIFLHCLPAHRGEEISETLLDDPRAHVWQEAENRLHAQKALMEFLYYQSL